MSSSEATHLWPSDRVVAGVDQVEVDGCFAPGHLGHQALPKAARPVAGPYDGDPPRLEHGPNRAAPVPAGRIVHPRAERPRSRAPRPSPALRSASAALAACHPGIPHTPPPAWVAELPL